MVADLACFPARIWPTRGLDERVWSLRHNFSAYDATYVALAETLDAELLTADRRLHRATTTHTTCRVTLVEASTGR
jgi:predicted nucleic acid-binding protein